jgi:hypothetical protein
LPETALTYRTLPVRRKWTGRDRAIQGCTLVLLCGVVNANAASNTNANAALLAGLENIPKEFTVLAQPPFIVLGDEPPEVVHRRATNTVKWAVDKLKQDFFARDPDEIIRIWLFKDHTSYTNHAWTLFHEIPTSRFGYYSAQHRALVMNISTGTGTLVHEIVHPFMAANFPESPAWFNEGFASLFEAATEKNGHIHGMINWRYKSLEKAIKDRSTISFEKLTSLKGQEFYGSAGGSDYSRHYAQARYLCYYLQEQGLLAKYYREFVANAKNDPTGIATLKRVLGEKDMSAFEKKWEKFILGLRSQ